MRLGFSLGPFSFSQRLGLPRLKRRTGRSRSAAFTHAGCSIRHRTAEAAERCTNGRGPRIESFEAATERAARSELAQERRDATWRTHVDAERRQRELAEQQEANAELQQMLNRHKPQDPPA